jgi:hypothetical protein
MELPVTHQCGRPWACAKQEDADLFIHCQRRECGPQILPENLTLGGHSGDTHSGGDHDLMYQTPPPFTAPQQGRAKLK